MPTPFESTTVLCSIVPIDISPMSMPRSVVPLDVVVRDVRHHPVRHDAFADAVDAAALDHRHLLVHRERDVDPLHPRAARVRRSGSPHHHRAAADVDAVDRHAEDVHAVEHHVLGVLDIDAVLAADHRDVLQRHVARADHDPAAHRAADERLRMRDHERPLHDAVQVNGRRDHRDRAGDAGERDRGDDGSDERAGAAELAAAPARTRAAGAGRARGRRAAPSPSRARRGRARDHVSGMRIASTISPSSTGAERQREPAGLVVEARGRRRRRRARARTASISATSSIAHQRWIPSATRSGGSVATRRDWMRPVSVYDIRGG